MSRQQRFADEVCRIVKQAYGNSDVLDPQSSIYSGGCQNYKNRTNSTVSMWPSEAAEGSAAHRNKQTNLTPRSVVRKISG